MRYTFLELMWLFVLVSCLGWLVETGYAAVRRRRLVNRGLINGPFCIIYGLTAVVNALTLQELSVFWIFVGASILATVMEWSAGHILEKLGQGKWWDYSGVCWNLDGYICLPASLVWGAAGTFGILFGNNWLIALLHLFPKTIAVIGLWVIAGMLFVDILATLMVLSGKSRRVQRWREVDHWFISTTARLEDWIYTKIRKRIDAAHPHEQEAVLEEHEVCFAYGCSFYKFVLLFVIGSFLGDIVETMFCRVRGGVWMSRSSLVWGPFSIVWGFAMAAVTVLLYRYRNRSDRFLFLMGTVLGGAYEYLCSVLTELVFGSVFWDYSSMPFNLGGRINLLYCFFWGFAAVVWFKVIYPWMSGMIERIPIKQGTILTWCLIVFMCINMAVSALALIRFDQRNSGIPATQGWQQVMDEHFDDERLERIYPNMIRV